MVNNGETQMISNSTKLRVFQTLKHFLAIMGAVALFYIAGDLLGF